MMDGRAVMPTRLKAMTKTEEAAVPVPSSRAGSEEGTRSVATNTERKKNRTIRIQTRRIALGIESDDESVEPLSGSAVVDLDLSPTFWVMGFARCHGAVLQPGV